MSIYYYDNVVSSGKVTKKAETNKYEMMLLAEPNTQQHKIPTILAIWRQTYSSIYDKKKLRFYAYDIMGRYPLR